MNCPHAQTDGAYVLGALSPAERSAYEAHLAECAACAAAVARLAPLPGLLGRVDPDQLQQPVSPGPGRLAQLLNAVTRQRRRQTRVRRLQLAGAVLTAAVVAAVGSVVWTGLATAGSGPDVVAMEAVGSDVAVTAQVGVAETTGGTEVRMDCQYPDGDESGSWAHTFRLVAVGADGTSEQVGSWRAAPGDEVSLTGMTQYAEEDLVRIELHDDDDTALLAYEIAN